MPPKVVLPKVGDMVTHRSPQYLSRTGREEIGTVLRVFVAFGAYDKRPRARVRWHTTARESTLLLASLRVIIGDPQ